MKVAAQVKRHAMLHLAIEKEVERPQEVGLSAAVWPDDRDDVVEGGKVDPRKRAKILDSNGADELDIGTLLVLAAGSLGSANQPGQPQLAGILRRRYPKLLADGAH